MRVYILGYLILLLHPIFLYYKVLPEITIGTIDSILFPLFFATEPRLDRNSKNSGVIKFYYLIFVYVLLTFYIHSLSYEESNIFEMSKTVILIFMFFLYITFLMSKSYDYRLMIDIYWAYLYINMFFFIAEYLLNRIANVQVLFPWQNSAVIYRPAGLFGEPSYYSQAFLPLFFFPNELISKRRNIFMIFAVITLILGGSLTGLYVSLLIIMKFTISSFRSKNSLFLMLVTYTFLLLLVVTQPQITSELLPLQSTRISNIRYDPSASIRVFKGFYVFPNIPLFNKLFGFGPIDLSVVTKAYGQNLHGYLANFELDRYSGFFYELFTYGIIGSFLLNIFLFYFIYMCVKDTNKAVMYFLVLTIYRFSETLTISNAHFYVFLTIFFIVNDYWSQRYSNVKRIEKIPL